jgi:hypothetical protein
MLTLQWRMPSLARVECRRVIRSRAFPCPNRTQSGKVTKMQAIDRMLDAAVLRMAALKFPHGYDVRPDAPDTLEKLCAHLDSGARMAVFDGGSDQTIFGDASVNYAFRAWHDYHHYRHKLAFDAEGEARACMYQVQDLRDQFGNGARVQHWARLLDAEINGQLRYAAAHDGAFPTNQRAFVLAYLADQSAAIAQSF